MISLFEVTALLLCAAVAGLHVLNPVLDYLHGISTNSPIFAAAFVLLALPTAYLAGVVLVYLQIAPALAAAVPPAALRRFAGLACAMASALLLLLALPLVHVLFLHAGW